MTITRSIGIPARVGMVTYGMAGGGYVGATEALDATVMRAAEMLREAYGMDVTIRFNSDRESGGAWLVTHAVDGIDANAEVGICADVMTEQGRARLERSIDRYGWDDHLQQILDERPAGDVRIYAHLSGAARDALARAQSGGMSYYHRPARDLESALAFVHAHGSLEHLR